MVRTAQDLIEQARLKKILEARAIKSREEVIKTAKAGMRKESIEKLKSYVQQPTRVSPGVRKLDTAIGSRVRKAVHLLAPAGMVKRITTPAKKKVAGRGRGRPRQTYKTRVLPSGKIVKVPTHVYKKMLSQEKAAIRLAQAQRQALLQQQAQQAAEQVAMQQDPRYQPSAEDAWADSEDMEHEAEVQQLKQQQLYQQQMMQQQQMQQPSPIRRAGQMFGKARITLMGGQQPQPMDQPQYARQYPQQSRQVQPISRPQLNMDINRPINPQVVVLGGKSKMFGGKGNIMDQKNEMF